MFIDQEHLSDFDYSDIDVFAIKYNIKNEVQRILFISHILNNIANLL